MEESEQLKIDLYQPKYHTEVLQVTLDISFFIKTPSLEAREVHRYLK